MVFGMKEARIKVAQETTIKMRKGRAGMVRDGDVPASLSAASTMCSTKRERLLRENAGEMAFRTDFQYAPRAQRR